jgi:hypothetical protein
MISAWQKDLTLGQMIPQLNPDPISGSLLTQVKSNLDASQTKINTEYGNLTNIMSDVSDLKAQIDGLHTSVNSLLTAITSTGFSTVSITGQGIEELRDGVYTALQQPDAPAITASTFGGILMMVVLGPTLADVNAKIAQLKLVLNGF